MNEMEDLKKLVDELKYGKKEAEERLSTLEKRYLNLQRESASYQARRIRFKYTNCFPIKTLKKALFFIKSAKKAPFFYKGHFFYETLKRPFSRNF